MMNRLLKNQVPEVRAIFDRHHRTVSGKKNGKVIHDNSVKASVVIEVYHQGKRAYFNTGVKITANQWNDGIVIRSNDCMNMNAAIDSVKKSINDYVADCIKFNNPFSLDGLKKAMEINAAFSSGSFLDFFYNRIFEKPISPGTRKGYISVYNNLCKWGVIQRFSDITKGNCKKWMDEACNKARKDKFAYNNIKCLRSIISDAKDFGMIRENPFDEMEIRRDRSIKHEFLTADELEKFLAVELDEETLCKSQDLFRFMCYTGMSFTDAMSFDFDTTSTDNGKYRYIAKRKKTGEEFRITLLKPAMAVLEKYGYHVPKIDQHVHNRNLRTICQRAGIKKHITSHSSRVTWASTIALGNNLPAAIIAVTMGHSNTRQTEYYAKLQQTTVDKAMDALDELL